MLLYIIIRRLFLDNSSILRRLSIDSSTTRPSPPSSILHRLYIANNTTSKTYVALYRTLLYYISGNYSKARYTVILAKAFITTVPPNRL